MALTRGTGRPLHDGRLRVVAAVAVVAMIAASGLSQPVGGASSGGSAAAALQLSAATPAELHVSTRVGAQDSRFWAIRTPIGATHAQPGRARDCGLHPRRRPGGLSGVQVGLSLIAIGRADRLARSPHPSSRAAPIASPTHATRLTEWYANGPLGLEQGLRLAARPAAHGPLTFAYAVYGIGDRDAAGRHADVPHRAGTRVLIRYSGLFAVDARGRTLPSHLRLSRFPTADPRTGRRRAVSDHRRPAVCPEPAQPRAFMSPLLKGAVTLLLRRVHASRRCRLGATTRRARPGASATRAATR